MDREFFYNVANVVTMLSKVLEFSWNYRYDDDESERKIFIDDYFRMAESYMTRAKNEKDTHK